MRVGDFAHAGTSNISIIDADSFWIDGYFEETKMAQIGDRAEAKLMGYSQPIIGRIETITRGISVSNAAAGTQGYPMSIQSLPGCASRNVCRGSHFHRQRANWRSACLRHDRNGNRPSR
jgi:hypothetical protein